MNASNFMDKQIIDLSRSNNSDLSNNHDFIDMMNPQSEEESNNNKISVGSLLNKKNDEILPNYDFQPIHHPIASSAQSHSSDPPPAAASATSLSVASRSWNSLDSKLDSSLLRGYNSVDHVEPDRIILERAPKANDSTVLSEIDRTMKKYIDSVLHAIDGLSARLSQLESRTGHLAHSVDELKVSDGNNLGSTDAKLRYLENILLEVQNGVQDLKDKQEVMEGHIQLAKLHISKVKQSPELPNAVQPDSVQQTAASAPAQQSGLQQFSISAPQQVPSLPPIARPPSQQNSHSALPPGTTQFPPGHTPPGLQRDSYFSPPSQTQEAPNHQYQMPPPAQQQQQPLALAPPPQQYQSTLTPSYTQPPQEHPAVVGANAPHISPPLGDRPEEGPYIPSQTYPPNLHQPASQPSSTPPHSQPYYGSPTSMYEPPPTGRSSSRFPSEYIPPPGPGEKCPYSGPASHFGSGSSIKAQPQSPVGSSSNYPQLPTAKILPQPVLTAAGISGGSNSGGSGNRVPIDDVVDKVTSMGFPKDLVRAIVRKLTENGQSVDLNVVLDKLMNDGDIQPQRGWLGR